MRLTALSGLLQAAMACMPENGSGRLPALVKGFQAASVNPDPAAPAHSPNFVEFNRLINDPFSHPDTSGGDH